MSPAFLELLDGARRGDAACLDQLVQRHYPDVQRMVHRWLAQDVRAKRPWFGAMLSTGDIVQEVFLGVVRDLDDVRADDEPSFVGLLATLVKNRILDAIRRHEAVRRDGRRIERGDAVERSPSGPAADPSVVAEQRDAVAAYRIGLVTLRPREQELVRRRLESETPFRELAEQLGYPSEDAARKAFRAAQARLLSQLARSLDTSPRRPA
ncbi:MAG: sigma-70 family RNA polymerase sigma factor [Planctomycetes bacterium]|nr:sigma-70 family RNA polymerase sigma factor [Planctomycetota bacterium]